MITQELNTIKFINQSSRFGNAIKRLLSAYYFEHKNLDVNLFAILDAAILTKKQGFIDHLNNNLKNLDDNTSKQEFTKRLLKAFNQYIEETKATTQDKGLQLIKKSINRYIDRNGLNTEFRISKYEYKGTFTFDKLYNDHRERIFRRVDKSNYAFRAFLLSFLVAFPEGALAVYGFGVITLANVILFGVSAFAVSYFLYRSDIYDYLKNWYYKSSKPNDDKELSFIEKCFLQFILVFAGVAMGALLFNSIYVPMSMLLLGFTTASAVFAAPLTAGLAAVLGVSLIFASVTALANIALFQPICYKVYNALKDYKNNFTFKQLFTPRTAFLLIAIAVMFVAQLWFAIEAYKILSIMLGLSTQTSQILAGVIGVLGCLNGIFYGKNLYAFLNAGWDALGNLKNYLLNGANLQPNNDINNLDPDLNNKRSVINNLLYGTIAILVGCCVWNATGVATGVAAILTGYPLYQRCAFWLVSSASFFANSKASYEAFCPYPSAVSKEGDQVYTIYCAKETENNNDANRISNQLNDVTFDRMFKPRP